MDRKTLGAGIGVLGSIVTIFVFVSGISSFSELLGVLQLRRPTAPASGASQHINASTPVSQADNITELLGHTGITDPYFDQLGLKDGLGEGLNAWWILVATGDLPPYGLRANSGISYKLAAMLGLTISLSMLAWLLPASIGSLYHKISEPWIESRSRLLHGILVLLIFYVSVGLVIVIYCLLAINLFFEI